MLAVALLLAMSPAHARKGAFAPGRSLCDDARTWTLRQNAASFAYPRNEYKTP
jgi:hypothetical protein